MNTQEILTIKAVLLYILDKSEADRRDVYSIVKTAYYAQQMHLAEWALPIFNDRISALPFGPVPSFIYDILKFTRGDARRFAIAPEAQDIFANAIIFVNESFFPVEKPDLDYLSESSIICLDKAIGKVAAMSFSDIVNDTHGKEWNRAFKSDKKMSNLKIAEEGGASKNALGYLKQSLELSAALG